MELQITIEIFFDFSYLINNSFSELQQELVKTNVICSLAFNNYI